MEILREQTGGWNGFLEIVPGGYLAFAKEEITGSQWK